VERRAKTHNFGKADGMSNKNFDNEKIVMMKITVENTIDAISQSSISSRSSVRIISGDLLACVSSQCDLNLRNCRGLNVAVTDRNDRN